MKVIKGGFSEKLFTPKVNESVKPETKSNPMVLQVTQN
jgi:hypothetical protein